MCQPGPICGEERRNRRRTVTSYVDRHLIQLKIRPPLLKLPCSEPDACLAAGSSQLTQFAAGGFWSGPIYSALYLPLDSQFPAAKTSSTFFICSLFKKVYTTDPPMSR